MDDDGPISRDLYTQTGNSFGNITDNMNLANLMSDPIGTDIVAGLKNKWPMIKYMLGLDFKLSKDRKSVV